MNAVLMQHDTLAAVSGLIERRMGLHFPPERHDVLARGLERGGAEVGFADPEAYAVHLLASEITPDEQDGLAQALTVGETYFFREPAALNALEEHVLPALIQTRAKSGERRIRLWSAGCCSGEEAYTLAIMLTRMIPDVREWDITILATDINPGFLRKARSGRYREWSFRGTPAWLKTGYFSKCVDDEYELCTRVRQMVSFSYLNLVEDTYPSLTSNTSAMDVILCRNVMMYFAPDRVSLVARRFHRALLDGGWLVMSPSEGCNGSSAVFTRVSFNGATLYRKGGSVPAQVLRAATVAAARLTPSIPPAPESIREPGPLSRALSTVESDKAYDKEALPQPESPQAAATGAYAQANYEAVLRIAATLPEPPPDLLALAARACANLGRLDDALEWCRKALDRDKLQAGIYHLQATVLVAKRDEPAALEALKRVLYLEPRSVLAHFTTANLLLQTGEPARAMKYLRKTSTLLDALDEGAVVPESDGLTAERLKVIVEHLQESLRKSDC